MNEETRAFVAAHRGQDVRELALHAKGADGVDLPLALDQIAGWATARVKLPGWASCGDVVYPPHLSMEQCSSETTARYKARLARRVIACARDDGDAAGPAVGTARGSTLVDLTGGFGVDFSYMARVFDHAVYVERQERLCALASHNMPALGLARARIVCADAEDHLASMPADGATLVFLDPARRDAHGARTYAIRDCTPDVLGMLDRLLAVAPHVMVKLSPMLDWHKTVDDFAGHVREVHIVSTANECKELLLVVARGTCAAPRVVCVNDGQTLEFDAGGEGRGTGGDDGAPSCADPSGTGSWRFLYEPNASVMKAGCFPLLARRFAVKPIARDSHLFVSSGPAEGFPGRAFAVDAVAAMSKRELRRATDGLTHANIAVRNFPMPVAALRRRLKLKDGGDAYLFATTDADGRHIVIRTHKA